MELTFGSAGGVGPVSLHLHDMDFKGSASFTEASSPFYLFFKLASAALCVGLYGPTMYACM